MTDFSWSDGGSDILSLNEQRLEYACHGPPPGMAPTIILLHEGLGCVALWRDFPAKLAKRTGWGVFVYSRAGYGGSSSVPLPRPLDYMTREALDVLPPLLNAIGFQEGILLGHSDGASIAAIYAGSIQDHRIRGLTLIAPHFFTEACGLNSISEARKAYEKGDLRSRLAKYHNDVDNAFRGWNEAWLDPKFEDWDISEVIDYFRIPVLAVQGEGDQYGTVSQINEIVERAYSPVDVVMLKECGHSPHLEKSEETVTSIAGFVGRLERIENEIVKVDPRAED